MTISAFMQVSGIVSPLSGSLCIQQQAYATGRERKEDDKPCETSVTKILFENNFRQTSPSFKQMFLKKTRKY